MQMILSLMRCVEVMSLANLLGLRSQHGKYAFCAIGRSCRKNQLNTAVLEVYASYDGRGRLLEEEDSACPALLEREFHSLHRNVPGLRRAGVDANAIRQHFYPDGGWGWIISGVAFLAHVLTTGFQLSYGLLLLYAIRHLGQEVATETGWLGAASWSVSMLASPIIIAFCRRKSTRLVAVLGGLVLALGILFGSFALQYHQVAFSYGFVVGVGAAMVRESSALMLGHYFKRRRQFVEMITMSGEGVGVALFSVILKEGVGKMGWRLGLQAVTGLVSISFFMGLLYRPASLYHPQRRAILHLKNQRKKVKEKKTHIRTPKPPFIDFSIFKSSTVRMFMIFSSIASFGIYTPIFFLSLHGYQEGYDVQDLVLLQTFLGLSIAFGIVASGSAINKVCRIAYRKINITRQHVCQVSITLIAISTLIISAVTGYRSLCILAWGYGLGLGGYRYSLKMFALERVRAKHFTKAWGFIKGAESIPVLLGVPISVFLNDSSHRYGRAGYYVCAAVAAISAILMFFVPNTSNGRQNVSKYSTNGSITSHCTLATSDCPDLLNRSFSSARYGNWYSGTTMTNGCASAVHPHYTPTHYRYINGGMMCQNGMMNGSVGRGRLQKSLSFAFQTPNWNESYQTCNNNGIGCHPRPQSRCEIHSHPTSHSNGLRQHPSRSRSVPEGLAHYPMQGCDCQWCHSLYELMCLIKYFVYNFVPVELHIMLLGRSQIKLIKIEKKMLKF
ncbi:Monocarboxylate transporter 2 [Pseudolycoriella hygida]|uniref:Monocarboxylate transporter 2 n=1 Tax=Pseudolycoriella hygida TaxID=35572 RepID=A0A9Q0S5E6_9DIPT|nr:Monocarboxylate transporter 2 [Pseudolycoriella hygida]